MKIYMSLLATLIAANAMAADKVQVLEGTGIDNQACRIEITRDGDHLKNVEIKGASEVFEIMSDRGNGYGPSTHIAPNGGEEVMLKAPGIFEAYRHSKNLFSDGETFSLDTNDLPKSEDTAGLKMVITMQLQYDNGQLVSATVSNKAKALLIATLASSKFTCEK